MLPHERHSQHLPFPIRLENPHVISPSQARRRPDHAARAIRSRLLASQVWISTITSGPTGRALNSSFRTRDTPEYKAELGEAIINFARIVPDGMLVFFASYSTLMSAVEAWQAGGSPTIWCALAVSRSACAILKALRRQRLSLLKHLVVEPRDTSQFPAARNEFEEKLDGASGTACYVSCALTPASCRPCAPRRHIFCRLSRESE